MYNEFNKKEKPFAGFAAYGGGAQGLGARPPASGGGTSNWEILFAAASKTQTHSSVTSLAQNPWAACGNTNSSFRSATESNTGASSRTSPGDGVGVYSAFFNKTGITKIAIASQHDGSSGIDPSSNFSRYIIYNLNGTTSKTIYTTIYDLDTYNLNNSNWAGNTGDSMFGSDSIDNFTGGSATSGTLSSHSGHYVTSSGSTPSSFCIWGINRDSDNDTQVLCAYSGNLTVGNGKSDSWRGDNPSQSFFSYWGNDWHSDSTTQTISKGAQTSPGFNNDSTVLSSVGGSTSEILYMLAYTP